MKRSSLIFLLAFLPTVAFAAGEDLSIDSSSIRFSTNTFIEGQKIRIYATSLNTTSKDLYGLIRFYEGSGKQVGTDQPISVFSGRTDDVFVDWIPTAGSKEIKVELIPFESEGDQKSNNIAKKTVFIEADFDRDGIPDRTDPDDDNDGVEDSLDTFPKDKNEQKDSDGDSIGNNADPDDDNDGVLDEFDALPEDPNESLDRDKDGIGDNADPDDDNDGIFDGDEIARSLDPANPDTDGDGVKDGQDAFPLNPTEQHDTDKDGIGNKQDPDDDNDKLPDEADPFPTNLPPIIKQKSSIIVSPEKEIIFDASLSEDPDGKLTKVSWKIGEEPEQEGLIIRHVFHNPGRYAIRVSAMDSAGEMVSKSYNIYVTQTGRLFLLGIIGLILALAIYLVIKYSRAASSRKHSKNHK